MAALGLPNILLPELGVTGPLSLHPERGISDHFAAPWTVSGQIVADSEVMVKHPPPGRLFGCPVSAFGFPDGVRVLEEDLWGVRGYTFKTSGLSGPWHFAAEMVASFLRVRDPGASPMMTSRTTSTVC